jgi:MYXO-CTERM domain-containing protein
MHRFALLPAALLLASTSARAHVPHDPCYWVAVSPGADPAWVVTSLPLAGRNSQMLVRTDNQQDVELRWVIDDDEGVPDAAMLSERTLAVGTIGEGLLVSDDVGDSFSNHPDVPANATVQRFAVSPEVLSDGLVLVAGTVNNGGGEDGAIWRSDDGGDSFEQVALLPGVVAWDLRLSPDFVSDGRAFALGRDGQVFRSTDFGASWLEVGSAPGPVSQIATGAGQRVWVATDRQGLWRSDDDGANFAAIGHDAAPITTLAEFPGDLVMFTYNEQAVWTSWDGGESFALVQDDIEEVSPGQPASGVHYYELLQDGTGTIWLASWEGLVKSEDDGASWRHVETYLPEAVRDLAMTLDGAGEPAAMASAFGGGGYLASPGSARAMPMGFDLAEPYFKRVATSHDYGRDRMAAYYLLTHLMVSTDGDETWVRLAEEEMGDFWDLAVAPDYSARPTIMAAGNIDVGGGWCVSQDDGARWDCHAPAVPAFFCSAIHISDGFDEDGLAWAACGENGEVWVTEDHGTSWSQLFDLDAPVWGLAGAPGGEALFIATHGGLFRSRAGGAPELVGFGGESVWDVAVSPAWDDSAELFVVVPRQGWYHSSDGGESFDALAAPTRDPAMTIGLSPDFGADRTLAVGGFDGTWFSDDAGASWEYAHALELLTSNSPLWRYDGAWIHTPDDAAINGNRQVAAAAGASAELSFRGVGVELIASTGADGGVLAVSLDGEDLGTVDLAGEEASRVRVWSAEDLADTWHSLELTLLSGTGNVDGALVWRLDYTESDGPGPGDTGPHDSEPETGDSGDTGEDTPGRRCACGTGAAGGGLALGWLALALAWRRRRGGVA